MKILAALTMVLMLVTSAMAVPYVHNKIFADGALSATPNPMYTILIGDNNSHTINTNSYCDNGPCLWYDLIYNGTGTCIIRLMTTTTKASWPAETVPASGTSSYLINEKTNYFNYSGCQGSTANSINHWM